MSALNCKFFHCCLRFSSSFASLFNLVMYCLRKSFGEYSRKKSLSQSELYRQFPSPHLRRDFIGRPGILLVFINVTPTIYHFHQYFHCTPFNLLIPPILCILGPDFIIIGLNNLLIAVFLPKYCKKFNVFTCHPNLLFIMKNLKKI